MHLNKQGFSLIEAMIATVVLTLGLVGVAGLQLRALDGTFLSTAHSTGSSVALAWSEWLNGLVSHSGQEKIDYFDTGRLYRENFVYFASLDDKPGDGEAVTVYLPAGIDDLVATFNGVKALKTSRGDIKIAFKKEGGGDFTARDLPPPPPAGSSLVLTVNANYPVMNTATIVISMPYTNAFVSNTGTTLRFVVASNM